MDIAKQIFPIEPKRANRWIIEASGVTIYQYLFTEYKIYNDGDKLMFETSCYETINDHINPVELFDLNEMKINYLDPVGEVIGGFTFNVKTINFESFGNYGEDDLLRYWFVIEIDKKSLKLIYETTTE